MLEYRSVATPRLASRVSWSDATALTVQAIGSRAAMAAPSVADCSAVTPASTAAYVAVETPTSTPTWSPRRVSVAMLAFRLMLLSRAARHRRRRGRSPGSGTERLPCPRELALQRREASLRFRESVLQFGGVGRIGRDSVARLSERSCKILGSRVELLELARHRVGPRALVREVGRELGRRRWRDVQWRRFRGPRGRKADRADDEYQHDRDPEHDRHPTADDCCGHVLATSM